MVLRGSNPGTAREHDLLAWPLRKMSKESFVFLNRLNSMAILAGQVGLELGHLKFRAWDKRRALP